MHEKLKRLGKILSKEEQKRIKGGLEGGGGCKTGPCSVYNSSNGTTYYGNCGTYLLSVDPFPWPGDPLGETICECITSLGVYDPQGGVSQCQN